MRRWATAKVTNSTAAIATVNALLIIALSPIGQMGLEIGNSIHAHVVAELRERLYDTSHTPESLCSEASVARN